MINVKTILIALQNQLNSNAALSALMHGKAIERGTYINMDANRTPWIGVYKDTVTFVPRTLGYRNWKSTPSLKVVIQATDLISAENCEDILNDLVEAVINAVTEDITISNTVDMVNDFKIEYGYIETDQTTLFYQSAVITFETEVNAS